MNALNPVQTSPRPDRRADRGAPRRVAEGGPQAGRRPARARRHPAQARQRLSARAVGRDAPARDDRDGARLRPGDRHRRRAHDRARRHGPGPDPGAPRAAAPQARPVADPHHPRPVGDRRDVRPGDGHVRRPGRRGGHRSQEVFRRPRHPYTQKLLSAFPNIHADRRTLDVIPGSPPDLRDPPPGCRFAPRCAVRDGGLHARSCRPRRRSPASASRATSTPRAATVSPGRRPPTAGCRSVRDRRSRSPMMSRRPGPARPASRSISRSAAACSTRIRRSPAGVVRAVDGIDLTLRRARSSRSSANPAAARRRPGGSSSS